MSKLTLRGFCEYHGNEKLVRAVKNQTGLNVQEFFQTLKDVRNASDGYCGFIYYSETVAFWRKHRVLITEMMEEIAYSLGEGLLQSVMNYTAIKDGGYTETEVGRALFGNYDEQYTQIYNIFAWGALEDVAFRFQDYEYENRD